MSDPRTLTMDRTVERAVFMQACEPGWDPRTLVRQLVWQNDLVHEELLVFPTLREALVYARKAFGSDDGPGPKPGLELEPELATHA